MEAVSGKFTSWLKDWSQIVSAVLVICGTLAGLGFFLTGGFRPESQVLTDNLTAKVDQIQESVKGIQDQLSAMPRPSDWLSHDHHLADLDSKVSNLSDRLTKDELSNMRTDTMLDRLVQSQRR